MEIASSILRSRAEWRLLMTMESNVGYNRNFLVYVIVGQRFEETVFWNLAFSLSGYGI